MFYFLMQLAGVIAGAIALGLLVGWLLWARALRRQRRVHHEQVGVLHRQLASLADENRRVQQRFAATSSELDSQRLAIQATQNEVQRAREAFTVSQQNLAGAEAQLVTARADIDSLNHSSSGLTAELAEAKGTMAGMHAELARLRLDSAELSDARTRTDELGAQLHQAQTTLAAAKAELDSTKLTLAAISAQADSVARRSVYLGRALDAAVVRANDTSDLRTRHRDALLAMQETERVASHQAVANAVAAERQSAQNDVRTLTGTWSQLANDSAAAAAGARREQSVLRGRIAELEATIRSMRAESTERLETARSRGASEAMTLAEQSASAEREAVAAASTRELAALVARHERQNVQRDEEHRLVLAHWRDDATRRATDRDADLATIASLQTSVAALEKQVNSHASSHSTLQSELDRVAFERHLLDERATAQEAELAAKHALLNDLERGLATRESELGRLRSQLADLQARHDTTANELAVALANLQSTRDEAAAAAEAAADSAAAQANRSAAREAELVAEHAAKRNAERTAERTVAAQLANEFDGALVRLGQLTVAHRTSEGAAAGDLEFERSQAVHARVELARLHSRLELAEAAADRQDRLEAEREEELRVARSLVDASDERATALRSELSGLQSEVANLQAELAGLQSEFDALQAQQTAEKSADTTADKTAEKSADKTALTAPSSAVGADDLELVEGIGPKIATALRSAGIGTFIRLEAASESQLRDALASAGLVFAPSLPTWSKQAGYLVRNDLTGFAVYQGELTAGREDR